MYEQMFNQRDNAKAYGNDALVEKLDRELARIAKEQTAKAADKRAAAAAGDRKAQPAARTKPTQTRGTSA